MESIKVFFERFARTYCWLLAKYRAKSTYPDNIEIDLRTLFSATRRIKVAIIDDQPFPWSDALEARGCKVTVYQDYTKEILQPNQKTKIHNFTSCDIIVCDIHGVGSTLYPGSEGISIIEELRRKHPLHVIAAYTGDPGAIVSKLKKKDTLDGVLARDWTIDDFLFNFDALLDIFNRPKERWKFIRRRLEFLGVSETKLALIQRTFVERVLMCQLMHQKFNFGADRTQRLVLEAEQQLDVGTIAQGTIKLAELSTLVSPFFLKG